VANYGYANSKITNNGSTLTDIGQEPPGTPVDLGMVAGPIEFPAAAQRPVAHLKVNYVGRAYPFPTQTTSSGNTFRRVNYTIDPGLTYSIRSSNGSPKSFRLSAAKRARSQLVTSDFNLGARRAVLFAYTLAH